MEDEDARLKINKVAGKWISIPPKIAHILL
jgi:hypothetical protein